MELVRWTANGVILPRNPELCRKRPKKKVGYVDTLDAGKKRIAPPSGEENLDIDIEVAWRRLDYQWREWIYDLYTSDTAITIVTHLNETYTDIHGVIQTTTDRTWTAYIDDWDEDWIPSGSNQKFDVKLNLKII